MILHWERSAFGRIRLVVFRHLDNIYLLRIQSYSKNSLCGIYHQYYSLKSLVFERQAVGGATGQMEHRCIIFGWIIHQGTASVHMNFLRNLLCKISGFASFCEPVQNGNVLGSGLKYAANISIWLSLKIT